MMMKMAINTDFCLGTGDPEPWLAQIGQSGFTHLHWCHHWNDDFLYCPEETTAIAKMLKKYHLTLLDVHGSSGQEKCWFDEDESRRKAGVRLVKNRLEFLDRLEASGTLMMHIPSVRYGAAPEDAAKARRAADCLRRSLDQLMTPLTKYRRVIAVENMWADSWEILNAVLDEYPADRVGICYDSGHANSSDYLQVDLLAARRDRLQALHLHDNDGSGDRHQPPFYGNTDWRKLAEIIRTSSYCREISYEISIRCTPWMTAASAPGEQPPERVAQFLRDAYKRCLRFANMVRG